MIKSKRILALIMLGIISLWEVHASAFAVSRKRNDHHNSKESEETMTKKIKEKVDELSNEVTRLKKEVKHSKVAKKTAKAKEEAKEKAKEVKNKAEEKWEDIKEASSDAWEKAKDKASSTAEKTKQTTEDAWEAAKKNTSSAANSLKEATKEFAHDVADVAHNVWDSTKKTVHGGLEKVGIVGAEKDKSANGVEVCRAYQKPLDKFDRVALLMKKKSDYQAVKAAREQAKEECEELFLRYKEEQGLTKKEVLSMLSTSQRSKIRALLKG